MYAELQNRWKMRLFQFVFAVIVEVFPIQLAHYLCMCDIFPHVTHKNLINCCLTWEPEIMYQLIRWRDAFFPHLPSPN